MMYQVKVVRRQNARRCVAVVFAAALALRGGSVFAATETQFKGINQFFTPTWSLASNWTNGVPATGYVADIYKSLTVNYNVTTNVSPPIPIAVQIAGNTTTSTATLSISSTSAYLETNAIYVGAGVTGQFGFAPGNGFGQVSQSAGSVNIDSGVLAIDSGSAYALSGSGTISAVNEQNAGTFTQTGGQNLMTSGSSLNNNGTYTQSNASILSADSILNNGIFNQAGGSILGPTSGNTSFTNNGILLYSAGTFAGALTNNVGAIIIATGTSLPFNGSLVNNGKMTVTNANTSIGAMISGSGLLVFNGNASVVTLTGANAYTGQTTVAAGTVVLSSPPGVTGNNFGGALGGNVIVATNAVLQNNANFQIANTSALTINGGTYNVNNHDQTVGALTLNAGLVLENTGLGLGVASGLVTVGTGTATITGGLRTNGVFTFGVAPAATLNVIGPISGYNTASASLILNGGGILSISGGSPLSSIDVKQGTLQLAESGTLGGFQGSVTVESGGTLSLTNQALTIGDLIGGGGVALGSGALTVVSTGSTFPGTIAGSGSLTKSGAGVLTLTGADSSSGLTTVASGTLAVANTGSLGASSIIIQQSAIAQFNGAINSAPAITNNGSLTFGANPGGGILIRNVGILSIGTNTGGGNGTVAIAPAMAHSNRTLLIDNGTVIAGSANSWVGQLDISNNDVVMKNSVLQIVTNQVKQGYNGAGNWNGNGITSSTAATDSTHLTAVGIILNNDGAGNPIYGTGTNLQLFDGYSPSSSDLLIKYTYYGDANLDGRIDGSDYSRIDNGFLLRLSGWYNGDFNYDGTIDGSDYTLMDNTFNTQGGSLAAQIARSSSQLASNTSIPEPTGLAMISAALLGLVYRARRRLHKA